MRRKGVGSKLKTEIKERSEQEKADMKKKLFGSVAKIEETQEQRVERIRNDFNTK